MNFPFQAKKAAEAAMLLLSLERKEPTVLKLVKLLYLVERASLARREVPIFGGNYFSMKHGPVVSEPLNLINGDGLEEDQKQWDQLIHERDGYALKLKCLVSPESLSPSEIRIIKEVHAQHADKRATELRDWCHKHVPEYEEIVHGRRVIRLATIAEKVGADFERIDDEAKASAFFGNVLAS